MKKVISIILASSLIYSISVKAERFDAKTIGAALVTAGVFSGIVARTLMQAHEKEKSKLTKVIQNTAMPLNYANYDERVKANFFRMLGARAAGLAAFSTISSGLFLLAYNYLKK